MTAPEDRPLIYIAGPYSADPAAGVRAAVAAADHVWEAGGCPVVPHLSMLWDLISPAPYQTWLDRDLGLLARCDGMLRLPGESAGADLEEAWSKEHDQHGVSMEDGDLLADAVARIMELVALARIMELVAP